MHKNRNQNNLLVEIMIAVLFFALCSTVILETFMASREFGRRSALEGAALVQAQDLNEQLYAAADPGALLNEAGFAAEGETWQLDMGDYRLEVCLNETAAGNGLLRESAIRALRGDEPFAEIPGARYIPGGAGK